MTAASVGYTVLVIILCTQFTCEMVHTSLSTVPRLNIQNMSTFKWAEFLLFSIKTHLQGRSDWLPCQCINSFDNVLCEVLIFLELQPQAAFKLKIPNPKFHWKYNSIFTNYS